MSAVNVLTEIIISRSCDRVAGYSANPDNAPNWYTNIKSVEWKSTPPIAVGSQIAFVAHFLGRRLEYTYEIVDLIHNKRLVMRTAEGPFPMETTYTWKAINKSTTRMTLLNRGYPSGFSKLMTPFVSFMMRRANRKDLQCLKKILEESSE